MRNYRGLTKDGKWVYGYYLKCRGHHYIAPIYNDETGFDDRWLQEGTDEDGCFEVIPETVGQQVGLKDKNGKKEAYADDLVRIWPKRKDSSVGRIEWDESRAQWAWKSCSSTRWMPLWEALGIFAGEIIGDIHTKPELLEQENG